MFTIIAMTSAGPRFAGTVGPYLGSAVLAAELDAPVADRPGKRWFVAVDESGPAVGFCGAVDAGGQVEIESLWVAGSVRGQGVGRGLLGAVLNAYAGRRLHAWCSFASHRLFVRAGFAVVQVAPEGAPVWWAEVERNPTG